VRFLMDYVCFGVDTVSRPKRIGKLFCVTSQCAMHFPLRWHGNVSVESRSEGDGRYAPHLNRTPTPPFSEMNSTGGALEAVGIAASRDRAEPTELLTASSRRVAVACGSRNARAQVLALPRTARARLGRS
jgi:hypothetical protein